MEENAKLARGAAAEEWRVRIESWRASGESGAKWCRSEGVSYQRFVYWRRKFSAADGSEAKDPGFVELHGDVPDNSGVELEIGGVRLRVNGDFDEAAFSKALRLLRSA